MKYRFTPDIFNISLTELALILSRFGLVISEEDMKFFTPIMIRHFSKVGEEEIIKDGDLDQSAQGKRPKAPKLGKK